MASDPATARSADRPRFSTGEGVALSVLTLAAGSFAVVGASANAPLIRADLGLTEVGVGAIASVAYLGATVTSRVAGRVTDRRGPTVVIAAGLALLALGVGISALAPGTVVFFTGVAVAGLGYGAINPPTNVLANPGTARRRGLVMSVKQAGVPLGGIVAGAVLPAIGTASSWRWACLAPVALCAAGGLLAGLRGRVRRAAAAVLATAARSPVRMQLPHGYGYGFVMAGAQVSVFAFTAVYLVEARGVSAGTAGLGMALLLVGGVLGRPLWGWVSDLHPTHRLRVLQAASVLGALSVVLVATVPAVLLAPALAAVGVCSVGWNGVYVAAVTEAAAPDEVGRTTGASLVLINVGAVVCPLLIGLAVQFGGGWVVGWLACATLSLLGVAVIALSTPRRGAEAADG